MIEVPLYSESHLHAPVVVRPPRVLAPARPQRVLPPRGPVQIQQHLQPCFAREIDLFRFRVSECVPKQKEREKARCLHGQLLPC